VTGGLSPNVPVIYIRRKTHSTTPSPTGSSSEVVGVMSTGAYVTKIMFAITLALVIILLRGDLVTEAQGAPDETPPVADAGPDQQIVGLLTVHLDGSASTDDGVIESYQWTFDHDGETVVLEGVDAYYVFTVHGEYTITLNVTDSYGNSDTDGMTVTVITPPGPPLKVFVIGRSSWIEISWHPPEDDGGAEVTDYLLWRGTSPDEMETYMGDWLSNMPKWTFDPWVDQGVTYYYAVTAVNSAGMSPLSEVENASAVAVPDYPQNLTVEVVEGAVELAWDPPEWSFGRVNVTGYQVHRGTDPEWLYDTIDVGLNTTYVDEDVEEGIRYYYAVGALSSLGGSAVTEVANVTVGAVQEEVEEQPWWQVALSFGLIGGLIVVFLWLLKMESRIGKKDED
jgi:PKD repeat protein